MLAQSAQESANAYVFDKAVTFPLPDGHTTTKYIDLYRKGCFVCEMKQSVERPNKDPLSVADPAAPKARRKTGTSVRGTAGWDASMIAAHGVPRCPQPPFSAQLTSRRSRP